MITIVGLENQNGRGTMARHCVGGRFLDYLVEKFGGSWRDSDDVETAIIEIAGNKFELIRPKTGTLNSCGEVLAPCLLNIVDPRQIIVACDDINLPLGQSIFYPIGFGDGGHNGLKSLNRELGFDEHPQISIGVGPLEKGTDLGEFFDSPLSQLQIQQIASTFDNLLGRIIAYAGCIDKYAPTIPLGSIPISLEIALASQAPHRRRNLSISPVAVTISRQEVHQITRSLNRLIEIIARTAKSYARLCGEENPGDYELVRLLEIGIPEEIVHLVRGAKFHTDHFSFDLQSGKLVEINASPMPTFVSSRLRQFLDIPGPGVDLTREILCERVLAFSNRHIRAGHTGSIGMISEIGGIHVGKPWHGYVVDYLKNMGIPVTIGNLSQVSDADVLWANLTYMMPERWKSVVSDKALWQMADIFPSPRNYLFTNKRFLALLCSEEARQTMGISQSEYEIIKPILPWTREIKGNFDVIELMLGHSHKLYAKPFFSSGGRGGASISQIGDLKKVARPAVIQDWLEPYHIANSDMNYDLRICIYGQNSTHHVWSARVWRGNGSLNHPMDAPVVFND